MVDYDLTNVDGHYVLDDTGRPIECRDLFLWASWMEENRHRLQLSTMVKRGRGARVSTIFLGLDHDHMGRAGVRPPKPILWETMVFDSERKHRGATLGETHGAFDGYDYYEDYWQERHHTRDEAIARHELIVEAVATLLKAGIPLSYEVIEGALP